jgi:hypothetical protein
MIEDRSDRTSQAHKHLATCGWNELVWPRNSCSYVSADCPSIPLFTSSPSLFSLTFDTHTLINHSNTHTNNPHHQTINMSAPNANAPNEGIVGQVTNSISVCPSPHSPLIQ